MVLDYLKDVHDKKVPRLSLKTIAEQMNTEIGKGTVWEDISKINELLVASIPSIEFIPKFPCEWSEIVKELEDKEPRPVIAWLWTTDGRGHGFGHSVIITEVSSKGLITYVDPATGATHEDIGKFISRWEDDNTNKSLVKVEVGKRVQRGILEYSEEVTKDG